MNRHTPIAFAAAAVLVLSAWTTPLWAGPSFADVIDEVQPKIVKIYGAGGFRGLEAYQSGFLVSGDGHILTIWSYVLDTDFITVHLNDGRKFLAKLLGADPRLEMAVLKIEADGLGLPHFPLENAVEADVGTQVLAFSNLYGVATGNEPASVQRGVVSATTRLEARRGVFETKYRGPVYVLDAVTNNPGAGGGALLNRHGELLGMLGKELRNSRNNTWLNYAIPISELYQTYEDILSGDFVRPPDVDTRDQDKAEQPMTLSMLGLVLVPDVLERTPPFVDEVRPNSPAAAAGLMPDDLVLFVKASLDEMRLIQSCRALREELEYIDRDDIIVITVIRGDDLLEFELKTN